MDDEALTQVKPKSGTWSDLVMLAGLHPGLAPPIENATNDELKALVGLGKLPMCSDADNRTDHWLDERGLQSFPVVYSMRYKKKLHPIKELACVTRYDLIIIAEAEAELQVSHCTACLAASCSVRQRRRRPVRVRVKIMELMIIRTG
eukprot:SAG25_NODE_386_length_8683_cov_36.568150_7_plen_147_part_00